MQAVISQRQAKKQNQYIDMGSRLMLRAARGDREAFERLYRGYRRIVVGAIIRQVDAFNAADIRRRVQEVFAVAWARRRSFDESRTARGFLLEIAAEGLVPAATMGGR